MADFVAEGHSTACHWFVLDAAISSNVAFISKEVHTPLFRFGITAKLNGIGHTDDSGECLSTTLDPILEHRYRDDTDSPSALRLSEFAIAPADTVNVRER